MKKKTLILASALGAAAIAFAASSQRVQIATAADHVDGNVVTMTANVGADLTDFYAWMWDDAGTQAVAFVIAVHPFADAAAAFPQNVHYVVNVDRDGTGTQIICQFESADNTAIRCWVGDEATNQVLVGDPTSATAPLEANGIKVFAGQRKDPFTFNLTGFRATTTFVNNAALTNMLPTPVDGCYDLSDAHGGNDTANPSIGQALVNCLLTQCDAGVGMTGSAAAVDDFGDANVLSLVVSVPLSEIAGTGDIISAYGSTHTR